MYYVGFRKLKLLMFLLIYRIKKQQEEIEALKEDNKALKDKINAQANTTDILGDEVGTSFLHIQCWTGSLKVFPSLGGLQ